ncbi:methyl-accepting chemotaxis protein [Pelagibacterium halotolerans]|uniref:methyl-accepting chemotaxis protein n=1 Tax=Pelagibacterium halotolerans TaxID=531813 RepID=UPI00384CA2F0
MTDIQAPLRTPSRITASDRAGFFLSGKTREASHSEICRASRNAAGREKDKRGGAVVLEGALSTLINLSGKMRMLSHRVAMSMLLIELDPSQRTETLAMLDAALDEFVQIQAILRQGKEDRIPREAIELLIREGALPNEAMATIGEFAARAKTMRTTLSTETLHSADVLAFSKFVATDLLEALNGLTEAIASVLDDLILETRRVERQNHAILVNAANSISDVSRKVKLISLNATIEAARAGQFGRSFGVIATEIRTLSDEANLFSERLVASLKS